MEKECENQFKPLKCQSQLQQTTFINIFSLFFSEKITFDVSSESSASQRIHLKHQALFFRKIKEGHCGPKSLT